MPREMTFRTPYHVPSFRSPMPRGMPVRRAMESGRWVRSTACVGSRDQLRLCHWRYVSVSVCLRILMCRGVSVSVSVMFYINAFLFAHHHSHCPRNGPLRSLQHPLPPPCRPPIPGVLSPQVSV
jgi:hypothetical protein